MDEEEVKRVKLKFFKICWVWKKFEWCRKNNPQGYCFLHLFLAFEMIDPNVKLHFEIYLIY